MRLDHVALITFVRYGEMRIAKVALEDLGIRLSKYNSIPGGVAGGATPVPIPNTEVKPSRADGTALVTAWESRSLPG